MQQQQLAKERKLSHEVKLQKLILIQAVASFPLRNVAARTRDGAAAVELAQNEFLRRK